MSENEDSIYRHPLYGHITCISTGTPNNITPKSRYMYVFEKTEMFNGVLCRLFKNTKDHLVYAQPDAQFVAHMKRREEKLKNPSPPKVKAKQEKDLSALSGDSLILGLLSPKQKDQLILQLAAKLGKK